MSEKVTSRQARARALELAAQTDAALRQERQAETAHMRREAQLEAALARIRGLLDSPMRTEDPECCLFCIGEIVDEMIGDRPGIGAITGPEENPPIDGSLCAVCGERLRWVWGHCLTCRAAVECGCCDCSNAQVPAHVYPTEEP